MILLLVLIIRKSFYFKNKNIKIILGKVILFL